MTVRTPQPRTVGVPDARTNQLASALVAESGGYRMAEQSVSLMTPGDLQKAFILSAVYHVFILFLSLFLRVRLDLPEFWLFVICDTALWTLGLTPLWAVRDGRLVWHDIFFWLWLWSFAMFGTILISYVLDPRYVTLWMNAGSSIFRWSNDSHNLLRLSQAEIVIFVFMLTILLTNQRVVTYSDHTPVSRDSSWIAVITGTFFIVAGIYGFSRYWSKGSFIDWVLTPYASFAPPPAGDARFMIIQIIALSAVSLGLVGWVMLAQGVRAENRTQIGWIVAGIIALSVVPLFGRGNRTILLLSVISPVIALRYFGFQFGRRTLGALVALIVLMVLALTVLRSNSFLAGVSDKLGAFSVPAVVNAYAWGLPSSTLTLLYADRVGPLALAIEGLSRYGQYLHGESLLAGFGNLAIDLYARWMAFGMRSYDPFHFAYEYIAYWRFGTYYVVSAAAVPPSYPGEYLMQWGYPSLVALSVIFGSLFYQLRKWIARSRSLIARWILVSIGVMIAFYVEVEISTAQVSLVYYGVILGAYFGISLCLAVAQAAMRLSRDV